MGRATLSQLVTMGFDLWKQIKATHYALMAAGVTATGVGITWGGPRLFRGALLIGGLALLALTAVLMDRQRDAQGGI